MDTITCLGNYNAKSENSAVFVGYCCALPPLIDRFTSDVDYKVIIL